MGCCASSAQKQKTVIVKVPSKAANSKNIDNLNEPLKPFGGMKIKINIKDSQLSTSEYKAIIFICKNDPSYSFIQQIKKLEFHSIEMSTLLERSHETFKEKHGD